MPLLSTVMCMGRDECCPYHVFLVVQCRMMLLQKYIILLPSVAPIQPALGAMPCRMVALEGVAESLIALSLPDGRDRFLEDVAEDTFFPVFSSASMSEGGEAAGENITTRSDIGQR